MFETQWNVTDERRRVQKSLHFFHSYKRSCCFVSLAFIFFSIQWCCLLNIFYTKCCTLSLKFGLRAQRKQFTVITIIVSMLRSWKCNANETNRGPAVVYGTGDDDKCNCNCTNMCLVHVPAATYSLCTLNLIALHFSYSQFHQDDTFIFFSFHARSRFVSVSIN